MITFKTAPRGTATVTEAHAQSMRDVYPGMTTESYIKQFYQLNLMSGHYPFSETLEREAPMLNPSEPEVEGS